MKKIIGIGTIVLGVLSFVAGIITEIEMENALTIIGGSDGPTEIIAFGVGTSDWINCVTIGLIMTIFGIILVLASSNDSK